MPSIFYMRVFVLCVCVRSAGRGLFTVRNTDFNFNEAGGGPNEPQLVMTELATHLFMYVCVHMYETRFFNARVLDK